MLPIALKPKVTLLGTSSFQIMDRFSQFTLYFFSFNISVLNILIVTIHFLQCLLDNWPIEIVVRYTELET